MSFPQTAGNVGAGIQTQYGSTTVENAAQGISAVGIRPTGFGLHVVADQPKLSFDFIDLGDPTLALHFRFGGDFVLRPIGADSSLFGSAELEKPLDAAPPGWLSQRFGNTVVADQPKMYLDFTELGNPTLALQFNFGPPQMVTSGGGLDSLQFGRIVLEAPATIAPSGWLSLRFGNTVVADQPKLYLDFIDLGDPTLALHFVFGGANVLASRGWDSSALGRPTAENAAQGIFARGIRPTGFGLHVVADQPKLLFEFDDASPYMEMPFQFYFGNPNDRQFRPPGWDSLQFDHWTEVWQRPFLLIYPFGYNATQYGSVFSTRLIVYPLGAPLTQYGNNVIWRDGEVQALGYDSSEFGSAQVEVDNIVRPVGRDMIQWGVMDFEYIPLVDQYLEFSGLSHSAFSQDAFISNWWREITLPYWDLQDAYGTPFIDFRIRYLDVFQGLNSLNTGKFQVGFHQDVEAIGRDHSLFGEPSIDIRQIYTTGWQSSTFGPDYELRVSFGQQYILPRGFIPRLHGEYNIWNRTQYVQHINLCPEQGYYCGVSWPAIQFFTVLNRDRTITPHGTVMTQFSIRAAEVNNTGRALLVSSFDPENFGPWYEQHMISYYVRYFDFDGWDSFRTTTLHTIHNAARAIYFNGAVFTLFGTDIKPILWRWLFTWGTRQDEHGSPWVSFSPRGVQIFSNRSHAFLGKPFVDFGSRYLQPVGWDSLTRWPFPILTQKPIPRITPRWIWDEYRMGTPTVHNDTPQLWPNGFVSFRSDWGWISHSPRYVGPEGISAFSVYRPHVEFRNRTIWLWGEDFVRVPQQLRIENVNPDPIVPTLQTIFMSAWCRGHEWNRCVLAGNPHVWANTLRPTGESFMKLGQPSLFSNGIMFRAHDHSNSLGMIQYGIPSLNRPQRIWLGEFYHETRGGTQGEEYGIEPPDVPNPRVSPHTIWARLDTPQQAKDNHPGKTFCEVDKFCYQSSHPFGPSADGTGPWFGSIKVHTPTGWNGVAEIKCWPSGNQACQRSFLYVGSPRIENLVRKTSPEGWRSIRFGYPRVTTPTLQYVGVWGSANVDTKFGTAVVTDNGPRFALNVSLGSTFAAGNTHIEKLNREVYVSGLNATIWGNNNPMVHYPRVLTPTNTDMTLWGTHWASHSPRWLFFEGHDSLAAWWTVFAYKMRVRNEDQHIRTYKFSIMTEWGQTTISSGVGRINPYGIAAPCVSPHVTVEHV